MLSEIVEIIVPYLTASTDILRFLWHPKIPNSGPYLQPAEYTLHSVTSRVSNLLCIIILGPNVIFGYLSRPLSTEYVLCSSICIFVYLERLSPPPGRST